jgi:hypothetical protein
MRDSRTYGSVRGARDETRALRVQPFVAVQIDNRSEDRCGSFSTEVADSAARPTSAVPRKLTSGPSEKLVAMGEKQTHALRHRREANNCHR